MTKGENMENIELRRCRGCRFYDLGEKEFPCRACSRITTPERDKFEEERDRYEPVPGVSAPEDPSRPGETVYQARIREMIRRQVEKGREKYGVTLDENRTLSLVQRVEHLEEELIDGLMYAEHIKEAFSGSGLTADDYQRAALRTAQTDVLSREDVLLNGAMGLCGEAGEFMDLLKKARFQGHELDADKLRGELGDVAWYLAVAAWALGSSLSEVLGANVEKLKKRYPEGFDKDRSIHRPE